MPLDSGAQLWCESCLPYFLARSPWAGHLNSEVFLPGLNGIANGAFLRAGGRTENWHRSPSGHLCSLSWLSSPLPSSCTELSIPSEVPMILGGLLGSELGADSASIADKNPPFSTSHLAPVLLPSCAQLGNNRRHKGSQNREHSSMAPLAPEGLECMCQWTRGWRKGVLPSSR